MSIEPELQALKEHREHPVRELTTLGDVQSGSLVPRYRRRGKPSCHCAAEGDPGHGPSWSLTRRVQGKTVTRIIPPSEVPSVQGGCSCPPQSLSVLLIDHFPEFRPISVPVLLPEPAPANAGVAEPELT